jgi:hypothetical protein
VNSRPKNRLRACKIARTLATTITLLLIEFSCHPRAGAGCSEENWLPIALGSSLQLRSPHG